MALSCLLDRNASADFLGFLVEGRNLDRRTYARRAECLVSSMIAVAALACSGKVTIESRRVAAELPSWAHRRTARCKDIELP